MTIQWLGHSCFKLTSKTKGNGEVIVVTDPYENSVGLRFPKTNADVVTVSHDHFDHNNFTGIKGNIDEHPFIVKDAGEYETKGVFARGIPSSHDNKDGAERGENLIFVINVEGVRICHLGDLGHVLTEAQIEAVGDIDILFVPVGGNYTIDAKEAVAVVKQVEPRIVIPMHYKIPGLKVEIADEKAFLKAFGGKVETEKKLKVAKKDLMGEDTKVVVLEYGR